MNDWKRIAEDLREQVATLTQERDSWKAQCEEHCGTISGLLRENMEKHQVYCPHCNPCRHAAELAPATILELCALLEKAEEAFDALKKAEEGNEWIMKNYYVRRVFEALAAIKQWKEKT